ncbi:MAG TPA: hypothetical protein VFJ14_07720 [Nocardioidaceae bacterium]|nr:hypothetical protein [Nocardioidaceae bacterium]
MDLSQTILAKSDQLNADDLMSGPRTFTVKEVRRGDAEQPVSIVLAEFPANRPFKPSKTVVRLLAYAWGKETDDWPTNPRMTLYRDEKVKWAGQEIGGIRVSHLSHIDKQIKVALAESKGKKTLHVIDPLRDDSPSSPAVSADTLAELTAMFERKGIPEDKRLAGVNHYTKGKATALEVITEEQARHMLTVLAEKPDVQPASKPPADPAAYDPTDEPGWGEGK